LLTLAIASLHLGAKIITVPKFEPVQFISTVIKYKVSSLYTISNLIIFQIVKITSTNVFRKTESSQYYASKVCMKLVIITGQHQ
jgi:hypothetical protein